MITLFTTNWCGECYFLRKELDSAGIQYERVDVDKRQGMELAEDLQIGQLPAAKIGDDIIYGKNEIVTFVLSQEILIIKSQLDEKKTCPHKVNGVCQNHNLQCGYPKCEER